MTKSSINFKGAKSSSKSHNTRDTKAKLDYLRPSLTKNNPEPYIKVEIGERLTEIKKFCKTQTGRAMQSNAQPIKEAIVNLNAEHTIADLKKLGGKIDKMLGCETMQIYLHKDEGIWLDKDGETLKQKTDLNGDKLNQDHKPDGAVTWKPNLHAHILFDFQEKELGKTKTFKNKKGKEETVKLTGKTIKPAPYQLSELQTLVAETLNMERGVKGSKAVRMESEEFKVERERQKGERLQAKNETLQNEVNVLEQKKNRAAQTNRAAREKYENLQLQNSLYKQRVAQWASKGIQEYSSSFRSENEGIIQAIKLQCQAIDNHLEEAAVLEKEYKQHQTSSEYREYQNLKKEIDELVSEQTTASGIEARISRIRKKIKEFE